MRKRDVVRNLIVGWIVVGVSFGFTLAAWFYIMFIQGLQR
jgi:hypothetical protein